MATRPLQLRWPVRTLEQRMLREQPTSCSSKAGSNSCSLCF